MKVWLDDIRPAPSGWIHVKTAPECIELLKGGKVTYISLDHDLGTENWVPPNNGYDVAKYIEEGAYNQSLAKITCKVHSQNPVGKENIRLALVNAYKYWKDNQNEVTK